MTKIDRSIDVSKLPPRQRFRRIPLLLLLSTLVSIIAGSYLVYYYSSVAQVQQQALYCENRIKEISPRETLLTGDLTTYYMTQCELLQQNIDNARQARDLRKLRSVEENLENIGRDFQLLSLEKTKDNRGSLLENLIIRPAVAQDNAGSTWADLPKIDFLRPVCFAASFGILTIVLMISIVVVFLSTDERRVHTALDFTKVLMGFFIGTLTGFLKV
jgi:hypothetical protein